MADRVTRLVLTFDGEAGTIDEVLSGIKKSMRSAVTEIERTTSKVELFGDIQRNLPALQTSIDKAREKVAAFRAEIDGIKATGAVPIKALSDGLKEAERAATGAERELKKQSQTLKQLDVELRTAGVDTSNLAREQTKLAAASKAAAAAAEQQAAKQLLGVKTLADIEPQIVKLRAAYETLRTSGTLSARELQIAQSALNAKIKETQGEVSKLGGGLQKAFGPEIASFLTGAAARFVSVGVVIAGLTSAFNASVLAAREYRNALADIGTVTDLTGKQLNELGVGVRGLATELGFELQAGLRATFELIRSGVPAENALTVLRASAEAAKAAITDIGTGAKAASVLIDAFGVDVADLPLAFDKIIAGSKQGGATLKEFAENGAQLGNAMRATGQSFDSTIAALTVMTDASNDAAGSAAVLSKILIRLGDRDVREKLRDLGIVSRDALTIFSELGKLDIGVQQLIDLGVASTKTAVGIATLTNNAEKLPDALKKIDEAAGTTEESVRKLYDSPKERAERFNAAIHESAVRFGEMVGPGSKAADVLARYINATHRIQDAAIDNPISRFTASLAGVEVPAKKVVDALDQNDRALQRLNAAAAATTAEQAKLRASLGDTADALLKQIKTIQDASSRDIGEINTRAQEEIAALDATAKATGDSAAKKVAIETKAAADRLAVIQKAENDITAAINFASAARLAVDKRLTKESVQAQIDALSGILGQYRAQYDALTTLQRQHVATINAVEQERVDFNRTVEAQLRAIRLQGLSAFDEYVFKVRETERLIADARTAGANGQIELAKKYAEQAIALAGTIKRVVTEDGREVVGQFTAQGAALSLTQKAADAYNSALDKQDTLAKQGLAAMDDGLAVVIPKIKDLQSRIDGLSAVLKSGLQVSIDFDEQSVSDALRRLDELTKPRTVTVTVKTVREGEGPIVSAPLNAGGPVGLPFAGGGAVFPRPSWNKVPGVGDRDSVPAALSSGSFVVRKAASMFYGDAIMSKLARGFAGGGNVFGGGSPFRSGATLYQNFFDRSTGGSEFFGDIKSGTTQSVRDAGQISAPQLPTDKKVLLRKILEYAATVAKEGRAEPQVFGPTLAQLDATLHEYERRPNDDTLMRVLQLARNIGLNLGVSTGKLHGIDIDGRRWHREPIGNVGLFHALGFSPDAASYNFYARGGDVVPAMLTPGEWVMRPQAVRKYGGGFMHAINSLQMPRSFLANVLDAPAPRAFRPSRAPVARFAGGGPVGSMAGDATSSGPGMASGDRYELHFHSVDLSNPDQFARRYLIPALDKVARRGRSK